MRFYLMWLWCLLLSCSNPSQKKEEYPPQIKEGYAISEKDSSAFDFSASSLGNQEAGELEMRLIAAGLVNIQSIIPEILVDLKYSSTDNFFGKDVYGDLSKCYMQPEVAKMLQASYSYLKRYHPDLTFLIFDAVRPQEVQQVLWDELDKPDSIKPLYVADPQKGSLHNFGVAVDLSLANAANGEPLDMGTHYDFFGYPAYPDREAQMLREGKLDAKQIEKREILRAAMKAGGFTGIGSEWWHFNAYSRKEAGEKYEIVK